MHYIPCAAGDRNRSYREHNVNSLRIMLLERPFSREREVAKPKTHGTVVYEYHRSSKITMVLCPQQRMAVSAQFPKYDSDMIFHER